MSFSFSFVANKKRKKRTKRKRKHATASYALTSVYKMDVASRACTLTLAKKRSRRECRSFFLIIIVNNKPNCFRLIAFAMTWRETSGWASL